jgi:acetate---CoA ligase (ADP-forming)
MDMETIFKAKNMTVIGVSTTNDDHPANVIFQKNHLRQRVKVFGVNSRGGTLCGEELYRSVLDIPDRLDLAVTATKAEFVPKLMEECIKVGASGAIIISGGFAETGQRDLQERLVSMAREANFPFFGPNCLGVYAPPYIDTLFIPSERMVKPEVGKVAIISQSGGILIDYMIKCASQGVGLSAGISIGNKALVKEADLLKHFAHDPDTDVIAFARNRIFRTCSRCGHDN